MIVSGQLLPKTKNQKMKIWDEQNINLVISDRHSCRLAITISRAIISNMMLNIFHYEHLSNFIYFLLSKG